MLKRTIAVLLLVALISSAFSRFFIYTGFEVNQKYIAENLCINKVRPWMHCNGHCYFMRKIKQAEDNEKKQAGKNGLNRLQVSFFQERFSISFLEPALPNQHFTGFPVFNYQYTSSYLASVFRPPKSLA